MRVRLADGLATDRLGDELVIVNTDDATMWALDDWGSVFLTALSETGDLDAATDWLDERIDVPRHQLSTDLLDLVQQLLDAGILETVTAA